MMSATSAVEVGSVVEVVVVQAVPREGLIVFEQENFASLKDPSSSFSPSSSDSQPLSQPHSASVF